MKKSSKSSVKYPKSKNTKKQDDFSLRTAVLTPENHDKSSVNSSRTSGGISKCLLTPCRRMGLTRKRITSTTSPLQENKSPSDNLSQVKPASPLKSVTSPPQINKKSPVALKVLNKKESAVQGSAQEKSPLTLKSSDKTVVTKKIEKKLENNRTTTPDQEEVVGPALEKTTPKCSEEPLNLLKSCVVLVNKKVMPKNKRKLADPVNSPTKPEKKSPKPVALNKKTMSNSSVSDCSQSNKKESLKLKIVKKNDKIQVVNLTSPLSSQKSTSSCFSDEDDDDFEDKTIIERKAYKKAKLQLQKTPKDEVMLKNDVEEIKKRIEGKQKKLDGLKTNSVSKLHSMIELEELINGWRGGCQMALEQLLEISRKRGQLRDNMGMEDLLKMLHIPHDLVKFDPEQSAFE